MVSNNNTKRSDVMITSGEKTSIRKARSKEEVEEEDLLKHQLHSFLNKQHRQNLQDLIKINSSEV
jgi:hypothetical protein